MTVRVAVSPGMDRLVIAATLRVLAERYERGDLDASDLEVEAADEVPQKPPDMAFLDWLNSRPYDDEPTTAVQNAQAAEAIAEYERGEFVSLEEMKRELGL